MHYIYSLIYSQPESAHIPHQFRPVDNEFYDLQAARRIKEQGQLTPQNAANLRWLSVFGDLIANTDQHFGNVSLVPTGGDTFRLAPAYDMLPMLYRPLDGVALTRSFTQPAFAPGAPEAYVSALAPGDPVLGTGGRREPHLGGVPQHLPAEPREAAGTRLRTSARGLGAPAPGAHRT